MNHGLLAAVAGATVLFAGVPAARAGTTQPVSAWAGHNASPLTSVDPAAPLNDLQSLRGSIGDASIVGLGESVHGSADETELKHRLLRFLVERMGFRSIAWEEDWTMGVRLNDYIAGGPGDADALASQMTWQYRTRQVADVLRWLRDFNAGRADKVRFVGVEYYFTREVAYDAVDAYVARTAPARLAELRRDLDPIRPGPDIEAYTEQYRKSENKQPSIRHAHRVYDLVERLPHRPGDRAYALALHNARQIVSYYEHYDLPDNDQNIYRDAHAAQNLKWWRDYNGGKIVYWAASAHTANAPHLYISPDIRYPSAGSYLRRWYGQRYRSIGVTFDHGTVSLGPGQTVTLPPPAADWFERPFGAVRFGQFTLDLHKPAPAPVRRWLAAPVKTRGMPDRGPDAYIDGGTLRQWFDVIVHRQEVTPAQPA